MAYRIVYGGDIPVRRKKGQRGLRLKIFTAGFLILFVLGVRQYWPAGAERLRECFLPGENAGQNVFEGFVSDVRGGMAVGEALTVFCRNLIQNGKTG